MKKKDHIEWNFWCSRTFDLCMFLIRLYSKIRCGIIFKYYLLIFNIVKNLFSNFIISAQPASSQTLPVFDQTFCAFFDLLFCNNLIYWSCMPFNILQMNLLRLNLHAQIAEEEFFPALISREIKTLNSKWLRSTLNSNKLIFMRLVYEFLSWE